jgi:hypothetical protein
MSPPWKELLVVGADKHGGLYVQPRTDKILGAGGLSVRFR